MRSVIDLDAFPRATPELLARRALLRRTDTKFLGTHDVAAIVLGKLTQSYALLGDARYATLYLDTADLRCFHDHRRGRRIRHKVRIRHYDDRKLTYLEIKSRASDLVTDKERVQLPFETTSLGDAELAFIETHTGIPGSTLAPALWITYRRITLLSLDDNERFTVDTELAVAAADSRHTPTVDLKGVVFFEVKQAPLRRDTPVMRRLREVGLRPRSVSKYCAGVIFMDEQVRHNRLRPVTRALGKVRAP